MTTAAATAELIREHRSASKRVTDAARKSPKLARALLVKAGICERSGTGIRLARPYR